MTTKHTDKVGDTHGPFDRLPLVGSSSPNTTTQQLDKFDAGKAIDAAISDKQKPAKRAKVVKVHCRVCGLEFSSKGNLNRHDRTAHRGLRIFCDVSGCNQSFSQAADLRRHKRRLHPNSDTH